MEENYEGSGDGSFIIVYLVFTVCGFIGGAVFGFVIKAVIG